MVGRKDFTEKNFSNQVLENAFPVRGNSMYKDTGRKGDALLVGCVWWGWDVEGSEADRAMYTVQKHLGSMSQ